MTKIFLNISFELRLEVGPLMFFRAQLFCHAEMFFWSNMSLVMVSMYAQLKKMYKYVHTWRAFLHFSQCTYTGLNITAHIKDNKTNEAKEWTGLLVLFLICRFICFCTAVCNKS